MVRPGVGSGGRSPRDRGAGGGGVRAPGLLAVRPREPLSPELAARRAWAGRAGGPSLAVADWQVRGPGPPRHLADLPRGSDLVGHCPLASAGCGRVDKGRGRLVTRLGRWRAHLPCAWPGSGAAGCVSQCLWPPTSQSTSVSPKPGAQKSRPTCYPSAAVLGVNTWWWFGGFCVSRKFSTYSHGTVGRWRKGQGLVLAAWQPRDLGPGTVQRSRGVAV